MYRIYVIEKYQGVEAFVSKEAHGTLTFAAKVVALGTISCS